MSGSLRWLARAARGLLELVRPRPSWRGIRAGKRSVAATLEMLVVAPFVVASAMARVDP